jgi:two-component system capsular synthesis response regulator RcsB
MKFENILVVEDQEVANLSLRITLEGLELPRPQHAYYCDTALAMIRKGRQEQTPYDLLVTDLYFEVNGSTKQKPDAMELIKAAKDLDPGLKVLVFSGETRPLIIRRLYDEFHIDGYVRKARGDAQELKDALETLAANRRFYSREFRSLTGQENQHDFTPYDKTIVRLLAEGHAQKDIPIWLESNNMRPFGLSSVEKRLNLIKTAMGFTKNEQLVVFCKEIGLI